MNTVLKKVLLVVSAVAVAWSSTIFFGLTTLFHELSVETSGFWEGFYAGGVFFSIMMIMGCWAAVCGLLAFAIIDDYH